ncbi:MAG: ORF6N domain-containing protein, partial [Candidatus Zixiibacteriota bacterium]
GYGGRRKLPYVFTEHGAIMLASVLNSESAVETSILVVRAFVRFREMISERKEIAKKITELEKRLAGHDNDIQAIVATIRQLMATPSPRKRQIGFESK